MSDDPINLNVARFNRKSDNPADYDSVTALDAAYEWIKGLDHKPDHIIVLVGRDMPDGSGNTHFFQAGRYKHHAQQGLCSEGALMIRES